MKDEVVIGAMYQLQEYLGRKINLPVLDWYCLFLIIYYNSY